MIKRAKEMQIQELNKKKIREPPMQMLTSQMAVTHVHFLQMQASLLVRKPVCYIQSFSNPS
jgi:hypothetical protein